ncbi:hypothetical protein BGX33_010775 [Mortierella sp. NVP41]|nr:hypothetical protein BGX33_010775 [Mortierella sp. NVP41]
MDPLSRLPVECLQHVLRILEEKDDVASLAALLSMNQHIASVTLPYLYGNPFRRSFHSGDTRKRNRLKTETGEILTRMLLSRLPAAGLHNCLSVALTSDPTSTTTNKPSNSPLDYLAHIRYLNLDEWASIELNRSWSPADLPSHQRDYILGDELAQIYQAYPFSHSFVNFYANKDILLHRYYHVIVHQETVWSLTNSILEQLQSLTIPQMFGIKRYLNVVSRFQSLESVRFITTDMFEGNSDNSDDGTDSRTRTEEKVRDMVQFVQEHVRRFKGRLKTVSCFEGGGLLVRTRPEYVESIQLDFFRILPPLFRPTHLGKDNWLQFTAHHQSIDLTHVRRIDSRNLPKAWEASVCNDDYNGNNQSLLQRCRTLKNLTIKTLCHGTFKWAVQERRELENSFDGITTSRDIRRGFGALALDETSQPAHRQYGLVPLESVNITDFTTIRMDDIDDIVFAFHQTLKQLQISATISSSSNPPQPIVHLGGGWINLPVLTHLELKANVERLVIDPHLLTHCPSLKVVKFSDETISYQCGDIVPCAPAHLASLQVLKMTGWTALTFDPTILYSTTKLASLHLTMRGTNDHGPGMAGFIPPLEQLNRSYGIQAKPGTAITTTAIPPSPTIDAAPTLIRPSWRWDWDLPCLTSLSLTSEFAYRFEFRMLYGCRALNTLELDIRSMVQGEHTRVITKDALHLPGGIQSQPTTTASPPEYLHLPAVISLSLHGEWMIDSIVLLLMMTEVFPNVEFMYMKGWMFDTLKELFTMFRTVPKGFNEFTRLDISEPWPEEMETLGIYDFNYDGELAMLPVELTCMEMDHEYFISEREP